MEYKTSLLWRCRYLIFAILTEVFVVTGIVVVQGYQSIAEDLGGVLFLLGIIVVPILYSYLSERKMATAVYIKDDVIKVILGNGKILKFNRSQISNAWLRQGADSLNNLCVRELVIEVDGCGEVVLPAALSNIKELYDA